MPIIETTTKRSITIAGLNREIGAILFDMDGVLVDSIPVHMMAWNYVMNERDLPAIEMDTYLSVLGRTNFDMITRYSDLNHLDLPLQSKRDIVENKEQKFRAIVNEQIKATPGVFNWLDFLKKEQISCAVASSGEMANIVTVLDRLRISDYFSSIISGAHLPVTKPDPTIFKLAAASLGIEPEKCLVIEDAPIGIQAAKSANMLCCALSTTFPSGELEQADFILNNLSDTSPHSFFFE